jgi:tetratricopeptide (TPR) repeat protein
MIHFDAAAQGPSSPLLICFALFAVLVLGGCGQQQKKLPHDPREDDKEQAAAANRAGTEFYKKARFKEAIKAFNDAIRLNPTQEVYYLNRGGARIAEGDWDSAIADLDKAIELDPNNPQFYGTRGYAYYKKGNFPKAILDHEKRIRMAPKIPDGYFNLARIYGTCMDARYRDGKKAVENARKACELSGWKNYVALDTLAAAYAEAGDFKKAVEWQQKALDAAGQSLAARWRLQGRMDLYKMGKPYREDHSKKDFEWR